MKQKKIKINNDKGLGLVAVVERPDKITKVPFVILLHGFTGWKEEKHIESLARLLAENGIGSIRFDASGSGESDGTFENNYRFSNYLADIESVYEYVNKLAWVDQNRVAVWGHSMGGQLAVYFAAKHPELKAMCSSQGSRNISSLRYGQKAWREEGYKIFSNSHFKTIKLPYSFFEDRAHFDAVEVVGSILMPKLFIAGTIDELVSASVVKEIYGAANEPKEYFEHPKAGHEYKNDPNILDEINARTLNFFRNHL